MQRVGIITLLTLVLTLTSAIALAGPIENAEVKYKEAQAQEAAGDWGKALDQYIESYQTYPKAQYVFKIATCYVKLGDLPKALDAYLIFNQYEPTKEVAARIQAEIDKLETMLKKDYGKLFIASSPSQAVVFIGEISKQTKFTTPTTRWVKAGNHSIIFNKNGYLPRELQVEVKRGDSISVYAGMKPQ
jgi:tetratricopeptide (TPR) repeat protein